MSQFILKSFGISTGSLSKSSPKSMSNKSFVAMQTRSRRRMSTNHFIHSTPLRQSSTTSTSFNTSTEITNPPPVQSYKPWYETLNVVCRFDDPNNSSNTFQNCECINGIPTKDTVKKIYGWRATTKISFTSQVEGLEFSGYTTTKYKLGYLYSGTSKDDLPTQQCILGLNEIIIKGNLVGSQDGILNSMSKKLSYSTDATFKVGEESFTYSVNFVICDR